MTTKIIYDVIDTTAVTAIAGASGVKVSSIVYPGIETATNTAGGETINLTGSGFQSTPNIIVGGTSASVVTFISSTQISFTAPAMAAGTYVIYVVNPDGGTAISIPGISYHGVPQWTTAAGSLGSVYEYSSISNTVVATSTDTVSYSLVSGTLPTGSTLNSSTGLISGTSPAETNATTFSFVIGASDAENQVTTRSFSLTINPDVVTWNSPSNGTTYNVYTNAAIANVTMSATSAAGQSITYTANSLPTGLSITGANIAGTPTVVGSSSSLLTATAANTGKTATSTINWVISIANDTYFPYVSLLLNGENATTSCVSDASTNNFALSVSGSATPNRFSPLWGNGYYGVSFDGSSGYLSVPASSNWAMAGNFTIECWVYMTTFTGSPTAIDQYTSAATGVGSWQLWFSTSGAPTFQYDGGTGTLTFSSTISLNAWYHIATVRNSNTITGYINGISAGTATFSGTVGQNNTLWLGTQHLSGPTAWFNGYLSNVRIVSGTAVYTSNFTPSTSPLTAISGTTLLTCQNNNFTDNSTNAFTITSTGTVKVVPNQPFGALPSGVQSYGSALFDGSTGYLTAPASSQFNFTTDFAIEGWFYTNQSDGTVLKVLAGTYISGASNGGDWQILRSLSGDGKICLYTRAGPSAIITSATATATNTWFHLAITRSSTTFRLFLNGSLDSTVTSAAAVGDASNALYIGAVGDTVANWPTRFWQGYISNFRIVNGSAVYTSAFTPPTSSLTAIANTTLLALQNKQSNNNNLFFDDSTINTAITRNGTPTQGTFSPFSQTGWSNYFDGSTGYLTILNNAGFDFGTGDFTIEAWIYPSSLTPGGGGNSNICSILSTLPNGTPSTGYTLGIYSNNYLIFDIFYSGTEQQIKATANPFTTNTWYHVAITNSGGTFRIFINGVSTAYTGSIQPVNSGGNSLHVGAQLTLTYYDYFSGYISNLRMVKGTAVYTSNFTPPTSLLTAISGTSLLTAQSNRYVDNSTNTFVITSSGTVQVQAFGPFNSSASYSTSTNGGSIYFNGSTDYLTTTATIAFGTKDFTIDFWFYGGPQLNTFIFDNRGGSQSGNPHVTTGATITSLRWGPTNLTGSILIGDYAWHHCAVARQGTTLRLFVDGVLDTSGTDSSNYSGAAVIYIARNSYSGGYLTGYLSNFRFTLGTALYTSAYTRPSAPSAPATNTLLMLSGTNAGIIDQGSKNNLITVGNAIVSSSTFKYGTGSFYAVSGSGNYAQLVGSTNWISTTLSTFTIEAWVYMTNTPGAYGTVIGDMNPTSQTNYWSFGPINTGVLQFYSYPNGIVTGNTSMSLNTWYHIAATVNAGTLKMFVNGVNQTLTGTTSIGNRGGTLNYLTIGQYYSGTYQFIGYIDDLRITSGVARYTTAFTPPSSAFITR